MQRRSLLALLAATVISSMVVAAIATSGTTYTWEKTFEVGKPAIECEIEIGDHRIVGCPVKVWVLLKLEDGYRNCCWNETENCRENCEDCWDKWGNCWDVNACLESCYQVNGTYSVHLYWWNETLEDWQHVIDLQEETNITLTCYKHVETYTFIPKWEGNYKVVVTLAIDSETYNFTNEE